MKLALCRCALRSKQTLNIYINLFIQFLLISIQAQPKIIKGVRGSSKLHDLGLAYK